MSNIVLKKLEIEDKDTISVNIYIESDYVVVNQDLLDMCAKDFLVASQLIAKYLKDNKEVFIKFTDIFDVVKKDRLILRIYPYDLRGHLKIEVDIAVDLSDYNEVTTHHRCCFFIKVEVGALESFGKQLNTFVSVNALEKISLYNFQTL